MRKKILFICGSLNQTTQMHQISDELTDYDRFFTPYYGDFGLRLAGRLRLTESTVMGRKLSSRCVAYLEQQGLAVDREGRSQEYELVVARGLASLKIVGVTRRMTGLVFVLLGITILIATLGTL